MATVLRTMKAVGNNLSSAFTQIYSVMDQCSNGELTRLSNANMSSNLAANMTANMATAGQLVGNVPGVALVAAADSAVAAVTTSAVVAGRFPGASVVGGAAAAACATVSTPQSASSVSTGVAIDNRYAGKVVSLSFCFVCVSS